MDQANTQAYGNPRISKVKLGVNKNPGILVSGHDLRDLEMLLEQTQGTGVDVYTHSEMLPAHYYPAFKKYPNFVGNYGNAWWRQKEEFESFGGPILMTTNCIVPPKDSYKDRLYTTGAAGYPGCRHIAGEIGEKKDFSEIIAKAKTCPPPTEIETGEIVGGFAHNQVIELADKIVDAVKEGAIKKFVVMAGCDGRASSRSYYTDFAKALPKDTVILTAGCAKYRYNKLNLGEIGGIPRVLDAGQCNDSYSLAVIAMKLKEVFGLEDINDLPIVYNIAWYEQKAVIVLLALLYLGVKNIHLGPTLPAFLSPNIAKVLVDNITKNQWKAEWGLSIYIEYNGHRILLDTGTTEAFAENADQMGVRLEDVEFGVLSHAHYDHSDGLGEFFKRNSTAKFYLQKSAEENCYSRKNFLFKKYIGIRRGYLETYKDRIVYADGDMEVIPGVTLLAHRTPGLSGVGKKAGMYVRKNGRWRPDDFSHEQSLVLDTKEGLVIFNSCSHGGADVIIREAEAAFPGKQIYGLIGGFHLFRSEDQEVRELADRIRKTGIRRICTGHCTGERAMEILKEELGDMAEQIYTGFEIEV